ncbi:MAG: DUF3368 domain-containing protein [Chloroflexota bacterium]
MKVVSDASPLVNLGRIGRLGLLQRLYGELIIPKAVWQEVVVDGAGQPGAVYVKSADWIKIRTVANKPLVQSFRQGLDAGEAEAIALALEIDADLLLMDERLGREVAHHFGVRYTGLIGVLVEAKHNGQISEIKSLLNDLRYKAGFRVSDSLYMRVLHDEGEI